MSNHNFPDIMRFYIKIKPLAKSFDFPSNILGN